MTEHDEFQLFELAGAKPKSHELQHALKRNVTDGQEDGASGMDCKKRRLFYANRVCAPHRPGNRPTKFSPARAYQRGALTVRPRALAADVIRWSYVMRLVRSSPSNWAAAK